MSEEPKPRYDEAAIAARVRRNAGQALFPAILVLVVGWGFMQPASHPETTAATVVAVMAWTLRIGGILLLIAAALCWTGALVGFLLDAMVSTCVAVGLIAATLVSVQSLLRGDLFVIVFAVFAALYVRAAIALWRDYGAMRAGTARAGATTDAKGEETVVGPPGHEDSLGAAILEEFRESKERAEAAGTSPDPPPENGGTEATPDGCLAELADETKKPPGNDA